MKLLCEPVNQMKPSREELSRLADCLKEDHARLCGELDVLKKAESEENAPFWQTLRDVCARLSAGLHEHILLEKKLLVNRNRSLGAAASETMIRPPIDHYGDYRYLQVITRCITLEKRPFLLNSRYQLLANFLRDLRCHMDNQEAEMFSAAEPVTTHAEAA